METLLIVLVISCALAFVVQVGRGIWGRTRTGVRHQQALDTLAGITQRPESQDEGSAGLSEHQAHVRLIGPGGQVSPAEPAALPPPRAVPGVSASRRPSPTSTAATGNGAASFGTAGIEAPTFEPSGYEATGYEAPGYEAARYETASSSASTLAPEVTRPTPVSSPLPPAGQSPVAQPQNLEPGPQTMPGLPPPPAQPAVRSADGDLFVEPPTVPVPIVQPQVFYFDDLSGRSEAPQESGGKHRRLSRRRRHSDVTAEHLLPVPPPPPVFATADKPGSGHKSGGHRAGGRSAAGRGEDGGGGRKSVVGVMLAAAAICVAVVAIGVTIVGLPGQSSPGAQTAGKTTTSSPSRSRNTTTLPPKPTTTTTPPKPAVLVSTQNGTATYNLSSASASIVVTASGPCWFEVRANSPLGQIINQGTLEAGTRFSVTGPAWIRLGNPAAVAVKVDGTPMTVPDAEVGLPLNLQFTFG
jgi:hypothetical protein